MTSYTQQAIERAIREACPELMELSFGCEVKTKDGIIRFGVGLQDYGFYEKGCLSDIDEGCGCCSSHNLYKEGEYEILGHPIRLEHVLRAIAWHGLDLDEISLGKNVNDLVFVIKGKGLCVWNMSKDWPGQSEETKQFVWELLSNPKTG